MNTNWLVYKESIKDVLKSLSERIAPDKVQHDAKVSDAVTVVSHIFSLLLYTSCHLPIYIFLLLASC